MVELPRQEAPTAKQVETAKRDGENVVPLDRAAHTTTTSSGVTKDKSLIRRSVFVTAVVSVAMLAGVSGYEYWMSGRFMESTDNAYVKTDSTIIAPRISGYIKEVLVDDNDNVTTGQILARIDDRDLQTALMQAKADVAGAEAAVRNIDAQIVLQQSLINQAEAALLASQASLKFAQSDASRYQRLTESGVGTLERAEQSRSIRDQALATVQRDDAALIASRHKLPVLRTQLDQAASQRDRALAIARQAELNLSYSEIVAPVDGAVGARTIRVGQFVNAGTQLMAVVPLDTVYVVANFKETQLTNIRSGQMVQISVDTFPGVRIHGRVDSISPGSGSEFSLLPADNATGNFTKVVQRIPVKIVIEDEHYKGRLRPGMSVVPSIDLRD